MKLARAMGVAVVLALAASRVLAAENVVAIVGATVVHPERDVPAAVAKNSTVIIRGNRIERIGSAKATSVPRGATQIDGRGKWVIPGLVDAHVHFFQSGNLYTRPDAADFNAVVPYAKEVARNKARLPRDLQGVARERRHERGRHRRAVLEFRVRDAARRRRLGAAAPRVAVAGPLISMVDDPPLDLGDPPIIKVSTPEEARALVQRELAHQPDYIKVWFIHSRATTSPRRRRSSKRRATRRTRPACGSRCMRPSWWWPRRRCAPAPTTSCTRSRMSRWTRSFSRSRRRTARSIARPSSWFSATATRYRTPGSRPRPSGGSPIRRSWRRCATSIAWRRKSVRRASPRRWRIRRRRSRSAVELANLRKVWDAGIPVVMGTDAGNIGTLHGPSVFREMELMVQAGLTPLEVLRSATVNGARAMGLEREAGTLAAGKLADLVVLDADPLAGVQNLSRIHRVIKDGTVFAPDELMRSLDAP